MKFLLHFIYITKVYYNRCAVDIFILNMTFVMPSCSLCPYSVLLVRTFQLFVLQDIWNRYADNA